jgi:hypothetical protein
LEAQWNYREGFIVTLEGAVAKAVIADEATQGISLKSNYKALTVIPLGFQRDLQRKKCG